MATCDEIRKRLDAFYNSSTNLIHEDRHGRETPRVYPYACYGEADGLAFWMLESDIIGGYFGDPGDLDWPFPDTDYPRLWWIKIDADRIQDAINDMKAQAGL